MIAKEKFLNNSLSYLYKQIRKVYLNSNIYNRKISRVFDGGLNYVPNLRTCYDAACDALEILDPGNPLNYD